MKAESSQHFASPKTCDAKRPTVEILRHPFPFQRDFQEGCSQCPAHMRPPLAPIQTCIRESPAQRPRCLEVNAESLKRLRSNQGEAVRVVRIVRIAAASQTL
jgi:hypothetical protein